MNKNLLDIYSDYLIAQNGYATATGLSQMLDGQISHDKVTRFLNGNQSSSKELWEYVKPHVRKIQDLKMKTSLNHFALKYKLILKVNQMAFKELKKMQDVLDSA